MRRRPRTLVELLAHALDRPDPIRVPRIDLRVYLVPLDHRHCN